jgi:hypothetical protein
MLAWALQQLQLDHKGGRFIYEKQGLAGFKLFARYTCYLRHYTCYLYAMNAAH